MRSKVGRTQRIKRSSKLAPVQPIESLLQTFHRGLKKLCLKHGVEYGDVIGEAALAHFDACKGFDPSRGIFSTRWWFILSKRIMKLAPRRTDAMAHVDNTPFDFEHGKSRGVEYDDAEHGQNL